MKAKTNTAGRSDLPTKSDPNVGSSREPPVRADRAEAQGCQGFFHTVAVRRKPEHMCLANPDAGKLGMEALGGFKLCPTRQAQNCHSPAGQELENAIQGCQGASQHRDSGNSGSPSASERQRREPAEEKSKGDTCIQRLRSAP